MIIAFTFISGFMVGLEFDWEGEAMVVDLGIIRLIFMKNSEPPDGLV
jgi:hypothetical protein